MGHTIRDKKIFYQTVSEGILFNTKSLTHYYKEKIIVIIIFTMKTLKMY